MEELVANVIELGPLQVPLPEGGSVKYTPERTVASILFYSKHSGGPNCYGTRIENKKTKVKSFSVEFTLLRERYDILLREDLDPEIVALQIEQTYKKLDQESVHPIGPLKMRKLILELELREATRVVEIEGKDLREHANPIDIPDFLGIRDTTIILVHQHGVNSGKKKPYLEIIPKREPVLRAEDIELPKSFIMH